MRKNLLGGVCVFLFFIGGCSSEQSTKEFPDSTAATPLVPTDQNTFLAIAKPEPIADEVFVSNDSLIAFQLEQARQHYLSASRAEENGDSIRAGQQFELAIQILNDLSYYPDIEGNLDFSDLSKAVVEDYERYIRQTGALDSTSSVFALREKLNVLSEQIDSVAAIQQRQVIAGTTIPLVVNGLVEKHIQFFTNRGRIHMEHWLERSGKYFPMMRRILREQGVPEEIVYLAMVESGLNPFARSWARAVGLWQFMKGTGALYGLKGNFWYDDRRDFEKATRAAARHLKDLYEDFEDWYLVMAAYNSGAGKVYRAMRRSGSNDYWELRRHLPRETRSYVPAYISAAIIAMNPREYGFDIQPADSLSYDYVTVNDCIDLEVLAECAETDFETLRELNPGLVHRCTPPTAKGFELRVPKATNKKLFNERYAALPDSRKMSWLTHTVRRGETIQKVARNYGISSEVLAQANGVGTQKRLKRGSRLMIPIAKEGGNFAAKVTEIPAAREEPEIRNTVRTQARAVRVSTAVSGDRSKLTYKVKNGDTIGHIAEWYGVRPTDIRNWNNLPYGRKIYAGTTLTVWVNKNDVAKLRAIDDMTFEQKVSLAKSTEPTTKDDSSAEDAFVYIVKPGDSLDKIAQEHGVTIRQIQRWNNLRTSRLQVGKKLALYPQVQKVESLEAKTIAEAKSKSAGQTKQIIYVVRKGDTISRIAQAHAVQESQLREWNSLKGSNRIYAGQELIIHKDSY
jgi:membrane-bound lytic murein transglycosylase D